MKVTNAYIERTYNLGSYESLKVGFEAILSESDRPLDVTCDLENLTFQHFQNRQAGGQGVPSQNNHHDTPKTPTPPPTADPNKCPKCGKPKKPQYDLCYTCHEEEKV